MDYRSIIESKYDRSNWQGLLYDIFRQKVQFWQQPQSVPVDENMAKCALYIGKITLPDGHIIAIYEVELSDSVIIERNRAGIRNLLCTNWRGMGCSGAFMFCFRQDEAVLRFSYVSESFVFTEDGSITKESTDTKRFTYLLGEGHRSRTAIKQFEDLKKSSLDLKAITKAFSVEALSDLFFKEYKKQYEDIIEFITGKRMVKVANKWEEQITGQPCREIMQEFAQFPDTEKAVRDYVKKLMGRLVFIQFLQKKGWMGCSAGESWSDGDKEFVQNLFDKTSHKNTFVDDVLEPLFNDINTKRIGDLASSPNVGVGIKIPYLNGGLFEKDDYDNTRFPLPAEFMKKLLDFFASYNFTIDENDPDDAEIGVDPEMLGRIFENLLEDNKDKGAFYTPKEIVQYMCRESLIAYLQTDVKDDTIKQSIRQFVSTYDATVLPENLKETVDQKLKDVKICDPAIGSGAFPMGLLKELYACRKAIEGIDNGTAVNIKTHIIQNNIYGVDIEKGAVDIARLRFWLALIVDEKDPHALPNMDFKIMQGNSLLEQYEGVELSGMSIDEQKKRKTKKGQLWQATLAFDEKYALDNIQRAIKEYYLTDNYNAKLSLRSIINENVRNYIINLKGCTPDVQRKIERLPIPNDKFFLWHIYFKEVFDKGGFDIVIGNPPYNELRDLTQKEQDAYKKSNYHKYAKGGRVNMFQYFYPLGIDMCNSKGIICFITQNSLLAEDSALENRKLIFTNTSIVSVDSYPERDDKNKRVFESAKMSVCFCVLRNNTSSQKSPINITIWDERQMQHYRKLYISAKGIEDVFQDDLTIPICDQTQLDILVKMRSKSDHSVYNISAGEIDMTKYKNYFSYEPSSDKTRIITGAQVLRYHITDTPSQGGVKYVPTSCLSFSNSRLLEVNSPRLVMQRITGVDSKIRLIATLLPNGMCCANSTNYISSLKNSQPLNVLLAILNSKAANYIFKATSTNTNVTSKEIGKIPIPVMTDNDKKKLSEKVDCILAAKKSNPLFDTSELEQEIDRLVYELYGLTYDEVLIVDPETPITREEYNNFKF